MVVGPLPYVPALGLLVVSRLVYGAASAGIMPIAQAWISGLLPQKERTVALARLSAGLSIGRILGSAAAVTASVMPLLPLMLLVASPLSLCWRLLQTTLSAKLVRVPIVGHIFLHSTDACCHSSDLDFWSRCPSDMFR